MIKVICPSCRRVHKKTDESLLGKIVKCKDCGFTFKVSNGSQPVQWDWMQNGQKKGPVDVAGLKELAKSGHLKPTDMIQRLGADWVVASQVKGLFPESTSVAASPPVPKTTSPEPAVSAETNKIQFQCSGCGKGVSFPSDKAGKTDKCPFCGVALQVPQTPDYYKNDLMAACAAIGKAVELRDNGESERANKGFELAETWVRKVLQNPCLPFAIEAEANCMLGTCCKSVGRFAEAQTAMEKGLALGRSKGFAVMEEWLYADDLGDVYDTAVHLLIIEGQFNQAKALLAQVEGFVSHYKSLENFDRMRHEGFILLARAMITVHEDHLDSSIQYFGQLLSSPYKEYFASHPSLTFVIGQASRNIGQIYHMAYGRSDEAIPYIEESLKYFQGDTEEFASAQTLLDRVRRKRGLIQAISSGWGQIAWGISLDDFLQTFSRASQDDDWWLSGEKPGDLAGFAIDKVKYAFNPDGQLYLIAFFPNDPSRVFADLPYVFGAPDKPRIASWTYGDIEVSVKGSGNVVTLTNVAFDDDASGYKKPLRESAEAKLSAPANHGIPGASGGTASPAPAQSAQPISTTTSPNFSFRRDFKRIQWGETLWLNCLRAAAAGIVWCVVLSISQPQDMRHWLMFPIAFPLSYPVILLPIGLLAAFLSQRGLPWLGLVTLLFMLEVFPGDPLVFILHKVYPRLVPVQQFGFVNFRLVIFVLRDVA